MGEPSYKLHECEQLPDNGIQIFFSRKKTECFQNSWNLIIRKNATEEDLEENHHLEEIGETIWQTIIEITHCPYCGVELPIEQSDKTKSEGKFVHHDFSSW